MYKLNETEKEYRFGDSGPKYLVQGPRVNLGVVQLQEGQDFGNHLHNVMEENFYILEGEIEFIVDDQTVRCVKGDLIHVEPGEKHYLKNVFPGVSKAVFCLGPATAGDKVDV